MHQCDELLISGDAGADPVHHGVCPGPDSGHRTAGDRLNCLYYLVLIIFYTIRPWSNSLQCMVIKSDGRNTAQHQNFILHFM